MKESASILLSLLAGYLLSKVDPVSNFLHPWLPYEWQLQVLLSSVLLLCLLVPYRLSLSDRTNDQKIAARTLLFATKVIINKTKSQGGVTLEQISKFNEEFENTKYFLKKKQQYFISELIGNLRDIRIYSAERNGKLTEKKRKNFVQKERILLNKIESSIATIESYIQKHT